MATTTSGQGSFFITSDPILANAAAASANNGFAAASAGGQPITVRWLTVSPICTAVGVNAHGTVTLRDAGNVLGTWGVFTTGVSAATTVGVANTIPVGLTYYPTGLLNALWTAGGNSASAAVNIHWGVGSN